MTPGLWAAGDRVIPARRPRGTRRVAPGSYLAVSHIGTDFFPDKSALAEAVAVYERASERVWPRSREQILSFFGGFELLEPGLVPKHRWRPVAGQGAADTPNIQWGAVGRKP